MDQLHLAPVTLIGVSSGANNAMHYAATHPADVERLVMIEMGPEAAKEGVDRVIQSIPAEEEFETEEAGTAYLMGPGGRADPVLARHHAFHALRRLAEGRVALKGDPALRRRDWRRPLHTAAENWAAAKAVACPTLLVRGGESKLLTVGIADRMVREMQHAELVTIEGAGHAVPLHRPAELEAEVRDWLAAHAADGPDASLSNQSRSSP